MVFPAHCHGDLPGGLATLHSTDARFHWVPQLLCGFGLLLASLGFLAGCQKADSVSSTDHIGPVSAAAEADGPPWFVDVTAESGLNFVHDAGSVGSYFMPQIVGSGAALF